MQYSSSNTYSLKRFCLLTETKIKEGKKSKSRNLYLFLPEKSNISMLKQTLQSFSMMSLSWPLFMRSSRILIHSYGRHSVAKMLNLTSLFSLMSGITYFFEIESLCVKYLRTTTTTGVVLNHLNSNNT